jgi:hypothetical protein
MPDIVKGLLTILFCIGLGAATLAGLGAAFGGDAVGTMALIGAIFGLLYGLEAGILTIYDLGSGLGWLQLFIDMTWSLPNTVFGFIFGNAIYLIKGSTPSRASSRDSGWVSYQGSFGNVLQTLGTINLGGAGQHERMHLLQARLFGPLYLVIFGLNYVVNFVLQLLWTFTVGGLLALIKVRQTAYFRPPGQSAVGGFWGWIYYANIFELWAYASGNP